MHPEAEPPGANQDPELSVPARTAPPLLPRRLYAEPAAIRFLKWILLGDQGVRVGWSVTLFLVLALLCMTILGVAARLILAEFAQIRPIGLTPALAILEESIQFLGLLGAAAICAVIERRRILDYNLSGHGRLRQFSFGLAGGFAALTVLVGGLYAGGWLHVGAVSVGPAAILKLGAAWGIVFLLTGLSEEGMTRCYMLFTLTRGINYWWALGSVITLSFFALRNTHGSGAAGVYIMALLGVGPCLLLHLKKSPSAGFWQAAWLTSTFFGYFHTFNKGETWIGIFSAAAIGFVFCVSVRLTGSAWWAIGFHAAWDWAQTFFYGTADSGLQPNGHFLSSNPVGAALWSGGSDGPEGSLLVIPVILLVLAGLILVYGRRRRAESPSATALPQLS
jgi:CAAX protease family protein